VNLDGTDYALFSAYTGGLRKSMPAVTAQREVVFVESLHGAWDGAGRLGKVSLRRPLHSYAVVPASGLFHSPSPLPDGRLLVSSRPLRGGSHAIRRLDPITGKTELIYDDPRWHDVQAKLLSPRAEPDGRSSVVDDTALTSTLYCLNVNTSDRVGVKARSIRVTDAVNGKPLGALKVQKDGSFYLEIPPATPIRIHTLDAKGTVLRSSAPIWAMPKENRGCIGCHEDGELTPENRLPLAINQPPHVIRRPAK
jgi:hypothetical protein